MTRALVIISILFTISAIAFNNCSSGFKVEDPAGINSSSSQCRTKVINAAKAMPLADASVCEIPSNYQCDLRRFRAGVGFGQSQEKLCTNIAGIGDACVPVVTYNFDTSEQVKTANPTEVFEGGSYNRDEVICVNTQITTQGIVAIQEEATTVSDALEKTIESCRQRGRL